MTLCKKPAIKDYEAGANILAMLYTNYLDILGKTEVQFLETMITRLREDYNRFHSSFLEDWNIFTNNLVHGQITALGFIIQKISKNSIKDEGTLFYF